jgi:purine nucleosidase
MELPREKWIIDADPGCDDMMAILYMMSQRNAEILMIGTIDGNVCLEHTTNNLKKILKWSRQSVPVHKGSPGPIIKVYDNVESYHYYDGLADIEEIKKFSAEEVQIEKGSSAVKIVENILKYPNEVNLLLLGPLTNIAAAYMLAPEIANLTKSVYIMGGSLNSRGNLNCPAEFNFAYDFISTKIILSNFKNAIITPWEPTEIVYIKDSHVEDLTKKFAAQNISLNEHIHFYSSLIIEKYTKEKTGIQFCDLYTAMTIYNMSCVQKFCVCELDISIDSKDFSGMVYIKKKLNVAKDMEQFVNSGELKKLGSGNYHLLVEKFHDDKVFVDFERIFVSDNYINNKSFNGKIE